MSSEAPILGDNEAGECLDENLLGRIVVRGTKDIESLMSSGIHANGGKKEEVLSRIRNVRVTARLY